MVNRNAISDIAERATSFEEFQRLLKAEYGILVKDHRGRFSYLPADRQKFISARALGSNYDRDRLLRIFAENARNKERNNPHWAADDPMAILFIKSDLRLVVDLQTCVKAQQSRAYAQKVKISICSRWHEQSLMCRNMDTILTKNSPIPLTPFNLKWQKPGRCQIHRSKIKKSQ